MPRGKNVERIAIPETDLPDLSGAVADYATFWPEGFDPEDARHWYGTQLFAVGTDLQPFETRWGTPLGEIGPSLDTFWTI